MSVGWDVKWCPVSRITTPLVEILPKRRKTLYNQSINQYLLFLYFLTYKIYDLMKYHFKPRSSFFPTRIDISVPGCMLRCGGGGGGFCCETRPWFLRFHPKFYPIESPHTISKDTEDFYFKLQTYWDT